MPTSRRTFLERFLKGAGCFAVAASLPGKATGAPASPAPGRPGVTYQFPQGLASGDPLPTSVILWTRATRGSPPEKSPPEKSSVEAGGKGKQGSSIPLALHVSRDEDFSTVVAERQISAPAESDHTARVLVEDLQPGTTYYYRFEAPDGSRPAHVGRTRTAPAPDEDTSVRFAFASCQAYEAGHFGAYRWLLEEDDSASPEKKIDFILHLGDFIYEGLEYGEARTVPDFPDGGHHGPDGAERHARTLADYRHLYKTYLSDPDLQEARARFPFVNIWDDHEFSNDAWQSAATYESGSDPAQQRKVAANRAWFEFIPAVLSDHPGTSDQPSHAKDFTEAAVENTPLEADRGTEVDSDENNQAAVDTLTIYRSFRWGRHLELVLTDTRSYRSAHPIPPKINRRIGGTDRYLAPLRAVEAFDAGKTYNDGNPPDSITIGDTEISNVRRDQPPGTMLGPRQKRWWKDVMRSSEATWKVWGHSVPTLPMRLDLDSVDPEGETVVFTTDTWDGYLREREELMRFLETQEITNFVSLSGDNHNTFAGAVSPTYEHSGPEAAAEPTLGAEFSICGISSPSVFQALLQAIGPDSALRPLVTGDGRIQGDQEVSLNMTFLHGAKASVTAAKTGSARQGLQAANPAHNSHLRYVDSSAQGIGVVTVTEDNVETEMVTIPSPVETPRAADPTPLRTARFRLAARNGGAPVDLRGPEISGQPPFPLSAAQG
ncbi:alkaline phosphatase D family protein [Salinibacter altiplanensis]|uniref:alkaline phosphatase D family protein n=1 Tax=Salinibacter altiplanensis TaxID=1803181 RepID=UPI000C9F967A|nr:alkaline phosphatase D family protein [Salinibacter altiplanensis]